MVISLLTGEAKPELMRTVTLRSALVGVPGGGPDAPLEYRGAVGSDAGTGLISAMPQRSPRV